MPEIPVRQNADATQLIWHLTKTPQPQNGTAISFLTHPKKKTKKNLFTVNWLVKFYTTPPSILPLVTWIPQGRLAFGHHRRVGWLSGLWPLAITILQSAALLAAAGYNWKSSLLRSTRCMIIRPFCDSYMVSTGGTTKRIFFNGSLIKKKTEEDNKKLGEDTKRWKNYGWQYKENYWWQNELMAESFCSLSDWWCKENFDDLSLFLFMTLCLMDVVSKRLCVEVALGQSVFVLKMCCVKKSLCPGDIVLWYVVSWYVLTCEELMCEELTWNPFHIFTWLIK